MHYSTINLNESVLNCACGNITLALLLRDRNAARSGFAWSITHAQMRCARGGLKVISSVHNLRSSVELAGDQDTPRAWTVGDLPAASSLYKVVCLFSVALLMLLCPVQSNSVWQEVKIAILYHLTKW